MLRLMSLPMRRSRGRAIAIGFMALVLCLTACKFFLYPLPLNESFLFTSMTSRSQQKKAAVLSVGEPWNISNNENVENSPTRELLLSQSNSVPSIPNTIPFSPVETKQSSEAERETTKSYNNQDISSSSSDTDADANNVDSFAGEDENSVPEEIEISQTNSTTKSDESIHDGPLSEIEPPGNETSTSNLLSVPPSMSESIPKIPIADTQPPLHTHNNINQPFVNVTRNGTRSAIDTATAPKADPKSKFEVDPTSEPIILPPDGEESNHAELNQTRTEYGIKEHRDMNRSPTVASDHNKPLQPMESRVFKKDSSDAMKNDYVNVNPNVNGNKKVDVNKNVTTNDDKMINMNGNNLQQQQAGEKEAEEAETNTHDQNMQSKEEEDEDVKEEEAEDIYNLKTVMRDRALVKRPTYVNEDDDGIFDEPDQEMNQQNDVYSDSDADLDGDSTEDDDATINNKLTRQPTTEQSNSSTTVERVDGDVEYLNGTSRNSNNTNQTESMLNRLRKSSTRDSVDLKTPLDKFPPIDDEYLRVKDFDYESMYTGEEFETAELDLTHEPRVASAIHTAVYNKAPDRFIVVSAWEDDLNWLKDIDIPYLVYQRKGHPIMDPKWVWLSPNVGNEAHAYLRFIIDYYHNLPRHTLFIHAHERSWHNLESKSYVIPRLRWGCEDYIDLAYQFPQAVSHVRHLQMLRLLWEFADLDLYIGPMPTVMHNHCCAEFIVHRSRIRARPREMYEKILDWLLNPPVWLVHEPSRERGIILEYIWGLLLGQPNQSRSYTLCDLIFCEDDDPYTSAYQ